MQTIRKIAVSGSDLTANCAAHFCRRAGFADITQFDDKTSPVLPVTALPAMVIGSNVTRLLRTIDHDQLSQIAHQPDRDQVRLARSGYLLAELPLGKFYSDRYGAPLLNIETNALLDLTRDPDTTKAAGLPDPEAFDLVVDAQPGSMVPTDLQLWYTALPRQGDFPNHANVTWLGDDFLGWQFATPTRVHFIWLGTKLPDKGVLHPSLHQFLDMADASDVSTVRVRDSLYLGNIAFVGSAVAAPIPVQLPHLSCGIEDVWVLARMLENYDDDLATALSEYEKFRIPRHRKISSNSRLIQTRMLTRSGMGLIARNLGVAFRSRFLPEMAMQQVDWLYQYDCIRGFR